MPYLIHVCCVCHKVMGKVKTTAFKEDTLSHGLCEKHYVEELKKLEAMKKSIDKKK